MSSIIVASNLAPVVEIDPGAAAGNAGTRKRGNNEWRERERGLGKRSRVNLSQENRRNRAGCCVTTPWRREGECQGLKRQLVKDLDLHGGLELDCAALTRRLSFSSFARSSNCQGMRCTHPFNRCKHYRFLATTSLWLFDSVPSRNVFVSRH